MKGTQEDWENLIEKIKALKETLQPINFDIGLWNWENNWWKDIENIANKLLDTYKGNPDTDWWSNIISEEKYGSGAPSFTGWLIE